MDHSKLFFSIGFLPPRWPVPISGHVRQHPCPRSYPGGKLPNPFLVIVILQLADMDFLIQYSCRFHMKGQCAIYFGLTQMTAVAGGYPRGELATLSGKTLQPNSTTPMGSPLSLGPTSLSWKDITGLRLAPPRSTKQW